MYELFFFVAHAYGERRSREQKWWGNERKGEGKRTGSILLFMCHT